MAVPIGVEDLAQDLSCSICLELFSDPVILECGHNFCQACITRYWEEIPADGGEDAPLPTCPECRCEIPGGKFTANRVLGQLAQKAMESLSAHNSDEDAELEKDEEVEGDLIFCLEDGCLARVLQPEHWGHQCLPPDEAVEHYKEILTASQAQLESRAQAAKSLQETSAQKVAEITAQRLRLEQHLSAQFFELHQWLQEKEAAMRRELRQEEELLLSELETNQRNGQEQIRVAEEHVAKIQAQLKEQQDPEMFLKNIKAFVEKYCLSGEKKPVMPVVFRDFSLGQFKGPIQYTVWREMLPALRPAPCRITLDPATNHPNLVLSKDHGSVHLVDNPEEEVPDGPERFSKSVCVLGAQGFTSGRHYWEVEVGDKTSWDVGVAKESVNRKEAKVTVKPSNGFWAIWLRNGSEYKALDSPSKPLALKDKPQKVGVYLDYEGGQVSFYNADTMAHIFTFSDAFSERLYPMFSPGFNKDGLNAEPLRLLSSI
ncbi:zinc-binding protein A33-like [Sphaerodactylus townsendi]|uniref:zinc-binding protein A33-like n=1 Tax=Sphaerodactylus townsendi TaxID=933632 RepID=UPI0020274388|nr:zinc-binding protein A33-like [Sphaerodactylus townsendi]